MERPWYLVCWPCVTQQRIRQKYQKIDLRNQNFIFTTTFGALQSTEGGCSGEVVVASGDAAMGVAGLRRALGGRHAAHGGRGAGQAAAAAGRGARRRERWKSGRATRRATGDGAAGLCGCTAGCPPSRRRASPWRRSWTKKVGPGSDDAGSSSVPEDLRSFPGDGASMLVSSGGRHSEGHGSERGCRRAGALDSKEEQWFAIRILQCFARQECFFLPAAHTDEPWSVALHGLRCTKPPLEDRRFSHKHLLDQKEQRVRNKFMHGHGKRI